MKENRVRKITAEDIENGAGSARAAREKIDALFAGDASANSEGTPASAARAEASEGISGRKRAGELFSEGTGGKAEETRTRSAVHRAGGAKEDDRTVTDKAVSRAQSKETDDMEEEAREQASSGNAPSGSDRTSSGNAPSGSDRTSSGNAPSGSDQVSSSNAPDAGSSSQKGFLKSEAFSWIRVIVIAIAAALVLNCFVIINSVVPSGSMESTIMTGSRMFGFRLAYLFDGPERGDIIIFRFPDDRSQTFVKRVIGTPGDTVEIIQGVTYVNGEAIDEPYLNETPNELDFGPYEVPEGSYFVMGDNRNHSNDARYWQNKYVPKEDILAKAIICYWPLSDFGVLK